LFKDVAAALYLELVEAATYSKTVAIPFIGGVLSPAGRARRRRASV
jgi:hypothetical protein